MALIDTPWAGDEGDKLYLQSGRFTSTLKTSEYVNAVDISVVGISWDGTNSPWIGSAANKLYLQSGQFTSTLKDSVPTVDTQPNGISWDGTDTPWTGDTNLKLYLQSGQFTSTVKTSQSTTTEDEPRGISYDGEHTPWCGFDLDKLYLTSGQFTSTLKTSENIAAIDTRVSAITWDGTDTPWAGFTGDKLYLQSGQFTSTIKTSENIGAIDGNINGIDVNDVLERITGPVHINIFPAVLALNITAEAATVPGLTRTIPIGAPLSVSMSLLATSLKACCAMPVLELSVDQPGLSLNIPPDHTIVLASSLALTITAESIVPANNVVHSIANPVQLSVGVLPFETEVTASVRNIVTNARNFAISEYSNFAFNSMAKLNGKYVYANGTGIYEGAGTNDDGTNIEAGYKTGAIDSYATEVQRLRDAYITFRTSGDIQLFSVGDEENTRVYNITNSEVDRITERRVKFERGIRDRYFSFGISNVNGSTFEMKTVKVLSEPIKKRR